MVAPPRATPPDDSPGTGIGVDSSGNATIDPTKNVLDLVKAESKYQDFARGAEARIAQIATDAATTFQNFAREHEASFSHAIRDAETRRLDEKADLRQVYDTRIADMLRTSVESTSSLVSTQLVQIQNTFNDRVSQLEKFRWESGGKASVSDPALTASLAQLNAAIGVMAENMTKMSLKGAGTESRGEGMQQMGSWIVAGIVIVASIGVPIVLHFLK